jgi:hypothetical protein
VSVRFEFRSAALDDEHRQLGQRLVGFASDATELIVLVGEVRETRTISFFVAGHTAPEKNHAEA